MMRNSIFVLAVAGAALLASCATTPKPAATATTPSAPATTAPATVPGPAAQLEQAKNLKAEIDKYNLSNAAPDSYSQGNADLTAGESAYGKDNALATSKLNDAIAAYQKVLSAGFPPLLKEERAKVDQAKGAALAAKADRATPMTYNDAASLEQQAAQKESAGDYAGAYDLLAQALAKYQQALAETQAKRAAAEQALQQAGKQLDQSKASIETMQQGLKPNAPPPGGASAGSGPQAAGGQSTSGGAQ